jgi:hypothetical protein
MILMQIWIGTKLKVRSRSALASKRCRSGIQDKNNRIRVSKIRINIRNHISREFSNIFGGKNIKFFNSVADLGRKNSGPGT